MKVREWVLTLMEVAPDPAITTGRDDDSRSFFASFTASVLTPGPYVEGEDIDPQEISGLWIGEKRTSIGKSSRTGP